MKRYKDYVPLPYVETNKSREAYQEIVDWILANVKEPKWSWSRSSSKTYKRALRTTIRLGVWLSPEDALAVRLRFNIQNLKR